MKDAAPAAATGSTNTTRSSIRKREIWHLGKHIVVVSFSPLKTIEGLNQPLDVTCCDQACAGVRGEYSEPAARVV
jgi:hypothetical protein